MGAGGDSAADEIFFIRRRMASHITVKTPAQAVATSIQPSARETTPTMKTATAMPRSIVAVRRENGGSFVSATRVRLSLATPM